VLSLVKVKLKPDELSLLGIVSLIEWVEGGNVTGVTLRVSPYEGRGWAAAELKECLGAVSTIGLLWIFAIQ
jgi:hypothetical protein